MISTHTVNTSHEFITQMGAELLVNIDGATNKTTITYRLDRDHEKMTLTTDDFGELVELLNEANGLIAPKAEG